MADPYIFVAIPCRDLIRSQAFPHLMSAIIRGEKFWNKVVGSERFGYGCLPGVQAAEARTMLWQKTREIGADWILWIDDDMYPPANLLENLWAATPMGDIVTGFYWRKGNKFESTVGRFPVTGGVNWIDPWDMKLPYEEVHAIGFGCVLMRRRVIDHIAMENNDLPFLTKPGQTEDVYFCHAARRLGYKVIAARDVHCGHVGDYVYTIEDRKAWLEANPKPANAPDPSTPAAPEVTTDG